MEEEAGPVLPGLPVLPVLHGQLALPELEQPAMDRAVPQQPAVDRAVPNGRPVSM